MNLPVFGSEFPWVRIRIDTSSAPVADIVATSHRPKHYGSYRPRGCFGASRPQSPRFFGNCTDGSAPPSAASIAATSVWNSVVDRPTMGPIGAMPARANGVVAQFLRNESRSFPMRSAVRLAKTCPRSPRRMITAPVVAACCRFVAVAVALHDTDRCVMVAVGRLPDRRAAVRLAGAAGGLCLSGGPVDRVA